MQQQCQGVHPVQVTTQHAADTSGVLSLKPHLGLLKHSINDSTEKHSVVVWSLFVSTLHCAFLLLCRHGLQHSLQLLLWSTLHTLSF